MSYLGRIGAALLNRETVGRAAPYRGPTHHAKASAVGGLISRLVLGQPVWPKRDYEKLAREGYQQNPIVARAVDMIAGGVAGVRLDLVRGQGKAMESIDTHPLLELLARPNPEQDGQALIQSLISFLIISGNGYVERTTEKNLDRMELYALRPDRVRVVPGPDGFLAGYEYHVGGGRKRWIQMPERGVRPVLHMKRFHPTDDWYGMSALDPAAWSIDTHSAASGYNKALLENGATPSGALVYTGNPDAGNVMPDDMFDRLKQSLEEQVQGARNAGKPLLLEGGLDWRQFGINLEGMQFVDSKALAAREIAFALGVPPLLLGLPGDNTYANYAEAQRAFYRSTVIPTTEWLCRALTQWFGHLLQGDMRLVPDLDSIAALEIERSELWKKLETSTIVSLNEKREALGYEPVDGGDEHYVSAGQLPLSAEAVIAGGPPPDDEDPDLAEPDVTPAKRLRVIKGRQ